MEAFGLIWRWCAWFALAGHWLAFVGLVFAVFFCAGASFFGLAFARVAFRNVLFQGEKNKYFVSVLFCSVLARAVASV
jgi:hypothetical protein